MTRPLIWLIGWVGIPLGVLLWVWVNYSPSWAEFRRDEKRQGR